MKTDTTHNAVRQASCTKYDEEKIRIHTRSSITQVHKHYMALPKKLHTSIGMNSGNTLER